MILSDNETKVDLLNNEAIAKTIVTLIKESKDQPISLGIHGDWGAGKSSILEMVAEKITNEPKTNEGKFSCIRFNGWKHQGFEDSKIALMSAIVSELIEKENLGHKAEGIVKKLWKNINWMSVAKTAGKTALGIATGTAPIAIMSSVLDKLKTIGKTEEGISFAVDAIGGFLKDAKIEEDTSSNTEFTEFQKNFKDLLDEAKIEKLVVLIDDLDRCLPDVAIDTLEAIRLFMFTGKTAFVVAADEFMIRYAVKKHFPDVIDENKFNAGSGFANKYLEKLIQVPFRIPALGEVEACNYILLLMVGSVLGSENERYKALCREGITRIQKPWDVKNFTVTDVCALLKEDYGKVENEVLIATQICHILSDNTDGNPRKIKRFVNMLLLRYEIAKNRGFGEEIDMAVLAKMMLAEYYVPDFYKKLPSHLNSSGVWNEFADVRDSIKSAIEDNETLDVEDKWFDTNKIGKWILSDPDIEGIDLRPYYYACKEKIDYFSGRVDSNDLSEIVDILFGQEMTIAQHDDKLKNLTDQEADQVFEVVTQKIIEKGQFEKKPSGIDGLISLVKNKPSLQDKLATFISVIPKTNVGPWILTGWDRAIPEGTPAHNNLKKYISELGVEGTLVVKTAVRQLEGIK